ncbi:CoA transferase [Streptomyces melanosporofaciens]|uniref:CoA transferase n=1 Tax=Streptomyces melanosporofaciens TaxID=67327 RepID=UPI003CC79E56
MSLRLGTPSGPASSPSPRHRRASAASCATRHSTLDPSRWEALLSSADVLLLDLPPSETDELGLSPGRLAERFPQLVTVSRTAFGLESCLFGASLALRNRARAGAGDHIEVALRDVAAYMD